MKNNKGNINNAWIETYSGIKINIFNPHSDDIRIRDIAHALAMCCRFNGHTKRFLSIAEHSFFVSLYVGPPYQLEGLLHDAAEAYLTDIPRPIKAFIPKVKDLDTRLENLNLEATQVTDLSPLAGLTTLRTLALRGSPVSQAAVEQLQAALPQCEISR